MDASAIFLLQSQRNRQAAASARYAGRQQLLPEVPPGGVRHRPAAAQLLMDTSPASLVKALKFSCLGTCCIADCGQAIRLAGSETVAALRELQMDNSAHINRLIPAVQGATLSGRILLPGPDNQAHFSGGVCSRAYKALLAIRTSRWNQLKRSAISAAIAGLATAPGGSIWQKAFAEARINVKKSLILAWINDWLEWHGDSNPLCGAIMVNAQVILASRFKIIVSLASFTNSVVGSSNAAAERPVGGVRCVLPSSVRDEHKPLLFPRSVQWAAP